MRISFAATILNEEKNITSLLWSLYFQSKVPDEIIIVDGGSKDNTVKIVREWISNVRSKKFRKRFKLIIKEGNRSLGRNEAVRKAKGDIIVFSDAGCILEKNFIRKITEPFKNKKIEVVAGFYKGIYKNIFEKSLIPYILVMPDKINPKEFLPSSRSMSLRKSVWKKSGGFPENLSFNEDYVFARTIKRLGFKIIFKKDAFVFFIPRENIIEAFRMFFKFASGDAFAGILRPKVFFIFVRFFLFFWILALSLNLSLVFMLQAVSYILMVYILWSALKNYRYVQHPLAFFFLPVLQITSDIAVLSGTTFGFIKSLWGTQKKL